jgi:hypothetical protein
MQFIFYAKIGCRIRSRLEIGRRRWGREIYDQKTDPTHVVAVAQIQIHEETLD